MKEKTKRKLIIAIWCVVFIPIGVLLLFVTGVGIFAEIPSFEELENPRTYLATELISEDGAVIGTYHIENRSHVNYKDLSPSIVAAAVATEDVRFYRHCGIDFRSLARVGVKTFLLGNVRSGGGGSTITQQLAKTLFPREEATGKFPGEAIFRLAVSKFKEWITAVKLERNYTKDEIMAMYMNAIFFGSNAYGIKAAANTFFNKEPSELTLLESAVLVGAVNKPTRFNPVLNYDNSLARRNHVLSQMSKYGFISQTEADYLMEQPIILDYRQQDHNTSLAPYFRDMLRKYMSASEPVRKNYYFADDYRADLDLWENDPLYGWLNKNFKPDGSRYSLDKDGLTIYTTINTTMQRYAEEAVTQHLSTDLQPAFFEDLADNPNSPFAKEVPVELTETVMAQARRWSDRYRDMKSGGASDKEIDRVFREEKTGMRVFSWKEPGYIDTVMTPDDSIRYYKSILRASLIAMEPSTGHIKAYIGGPEYRYFKYDNARQGKRQVGSTIKPFLYTLAMQEGPLRQGAERAPDLRAGRHHLDPRERGPHRIHRQGSHPQVGPDTKQQQHIGLPHAPVRSHRHGGDVPQAGHHILSPALPVPVPRTRRHHAAGNGGRIQHLSQPRRAYRPGIRHPHRGQRGQCAGHIQSPQAGSRQRGHRIPDGQPDGGSGQ